MCTPLVYLVTGRTLSRLRYCYWTRKEAVGHGTHPSKPFTVVGKYFEVLYRVTA